MIFVLILLTSVIAVFAHTIIYYVKQLRKYKDINKLPGPSAIEFLSNMLKTNSIYDKYHYMEGLSAKYGSILKIWIKPFDPVIMVCDNEIIEKILLSKDHLQRGVTHDILKSLFGKGLAGTNNIDKWRKERKICSVAFQHSTIRGFLPLLSSHVAKFMETLKKDTGLIVDLQPLIHLFALDVVFETLTKQTQNFQRNKDHSYLNALSRYLQSATRRIYSIFLINEFIFKCSKEYKITNDAVQNLEKFSQDVIQTAKTRTKDGSFKNSKQRIIDILIATDMPDDVLVQQLSAFIVGTWILQTLNMYTKEVNLPNKFIAFLIKGHDTVAQSQCFILYELAKHRFVQEKLYEEIVSKIGLDETAEITYNDLQNMTYLEAVIHETLRFVPIAAVMDRKLGCDVTIDGIKYPKGTAFVFNLSALHMSERYFKYPNKFDPDRFLPENANLRHRNSFIPFSTGPRDCIGKPYAMLLLKVFVAKIIQKFRVLPIENHELRLTVEGITTSISGVPVVFQERN